MNAITSNVGATILPFPVPANDRAPDKSRISPDHPSVARILYRGTVVTTTDPDVVVAVLHSIADDHATAVAEAVALERRRSFHLI